MMELVLCSFIHFRFFLSQRKGVSAANSKFKQFTCWNFVYTILRKINIWCIHCLVTHVLHFSGNSDKSITRAFYYLFKWYNIFECKHRNVCNQLGFIGGKYKMKQYEGQRISLYKPITDAMTEMFQLNLQEYDIINDYSYIATRIFFIVCSKKHIFWFHHHI